MRLEIKSKFAKIITASLIALVALTGAPTNSPVFAAENSPIVTTQTAETTAAKSSYYVTETRTFSNTNTIPPTQIYVYRIINGFAYGGYINRFDYYAVDGGWVAVYKGDIYAD